MRKLKIEQAQIAARLLTSSLWVGADIAVKSFARNSSAGQLLSTTIGLAKSTFGDTLTQGITDRLTRHESQSSVQDLNRAIGAAIAEVLREAAQQDASLTPLISSAPVFWTSLAEDDQAILRSEVTECFSVHAEEMDSVAALSLEQWGKFVEGLATEAQVTLTPQSLEELASALHAHFASALRSVLLEDEARGGQSYASVMLMIVGEISATLRDGHEADRARHEEILARLEALQAQVERGQSAVSKSVLTDATPVQARALENPALKHNLPQQLTSFIGREKEMEEVRELLETTRLLTLTGPGGTGKTRLSLQTAAERLDSFEDGVWFVELASVSNPGLVPQTVSEALSVKEEPGKPILQTLTDHLKAKHLLLVLDNCEHLLDACAKVANAVLRQCPHVKVLASSREGLRIAGELTYHVPSLSLPDPKAFHSFESVVEFESVRLFVDRASQVKTDFRVTDRNASALAWVCYRLDGIPLAVELAAARVRSLTVEDINTRLDQRFRLLTGGSRTALPRQQTLRSLIDWSYDLLNESEKALFGRLSVFLDGWTLEAAEQVCTGDPVEEWEVLDLLTSLVDKSLVVAETSGATVRHRLLETIRQYAWDRLMENGEGEIGRERHRDYFLALAESAKPISQQREWLARLEEEHENLRGALEWSLLETGVEGGLRLCGALVTFWNTRGHFSEGREWCVRVLGKAGDGGGTQARADALNTAGMLAFAQGDYAPARSYYEEGLAHWRKAGNQRGISGALNGLGNVAALQGDYASARAYYEEGLTILREMGDRSGMTALLTGLGNVAFSQGDYASAQEYHKESLTIRKELGGRNGIAASLCNLGDTAFALNDYASARAYYEESLTLFRELGFQQGLANALNGLGSLAYLQGDYASARAYYEESLTIRREIGDRSGIATSLCNLGCVAFAQDDHASAWTYHQESLNLYREIGYRWGAAYALGSLGDVASRQSDYASARAYYEESLTIRGEIGDRSGIASSLEAFAGLAAKASLGEKSTLLYGAAEALREEVGAPRSPEEQAPYDQGVAVVRRELSEEAFSTAWAKGRAMAPEQAIVYALEATGHDPAPA
jgi:non-specific serine/threonine protein kinase